MPAMAAPTVRRIRWLAGLLLAAPYAAIMSTVAAFLLMISSSLVRDLYQRTINPEGVASSTIKLISYLTTALVGIVVMLGGHQPAGLPAVHHRLHRQRPGLRFLIPMILTLYWQRATRQGMLAGMIGGLPGGARAVRPGLDRQHRSSESGRERRRGCPGPRGVASGQHAMDTRLGRKAAR